jgi:hypothetical protein
MFYGKSEHTFWKIHAQSHRTPPPVDEELDRRASNLSGKIL